MDCVGVSPLVAVRKDEVVVASLEILNLDLLIDLLQLKLLF